MKRFYLDQILSHENGHEPSCVAQGVLFDNGSVALSLTLPRLKAYYGQYFKHDPNRDLPMVFPTFDVTPPGATLTGFRNEFEAKKFSVRLLDALSDPAT